MQKLSRQRSRLTTDDVGFGGDDRVSHSNGAWAVVKGDFRIGSDRIHLTVVFLAKQEDIFCTKNKVRLGWKELVDWKVGAGACKQFQTELAI